MWCGSSAISSVGRSAQRRRCTSEPAATVAYVTDDAVPVTRLRPGAVGPVRLQVDAVARGVQRPLAADVRRRGDHGHPRHAPLGEHPMGDVQAERRLAGRGRRGREERLAGGLEDGSGRGLLPLAERALRSARTAGSGPPWGGEERRSRTSREAGRYEADRTPRRRSATCREDDARAATASTPASVASSNSRFAIESLDPPLRVRLWASEVRFPDCVNAARSPEAMARALIETNTGPCHANLDFSALYVDNSRFACHRRSRVVLRDRVEVNACAFAQSGEPGSPAHKRIRIRRVKQLDREARVA